MWRIELLREFERWLATLPHDTQAAIGHDLDLLAAHGPASAT
jgi:hypothetical protein